MFKDKTVGSEELSKSSLHKPLHYQQQRHYMNRLKKNQMCHLNHKIDKNRIIQCQGKQAVHFKDRLAMQVHVARTSRAAIPQFGPTSALRRGSSLLPLWIQ